MTVLGLHEVRKVYGDRVVLEGATLGVERGDRVGVVGVNGSGKSTLLMLAAGREEPDAGSVVHARQARVHLLEQEATLPDAATPSEVVLAADTPAARAARSLAAATRAVAERPDDRDALAAYQAAEEAMSQHGGWEVDAAARAALDRLGVAEVDRPIRGRSGGERKRIALAAALADPPEVLLLDEPTNHLDVDAVEWLEARLARWSGALLLVTHDRYLLDAVANRVVEVHAGALHAHRGGYASYLEAREERREQAAAEARRAANRAREELAYLRQGPKARSSKSRARVQRAHAALEAADDAQPDESRLSLALPTPRLGSKVVELHRAGVQLGDRWVLSEVDWRLDPRERMGVVGPNGSGKTTLLALLAGELAPAAGRRDAGETVRVGFYRQVADDLALTARVHDVVDEEVRSVSLGPGQRRLSASELLERFLFDASLQRAVVGDLSGGERRRLELLRVLARAPNVLLLDEPTNDLDLDTLAVLEELLDTWPGALVVASHDRFLLDRVCGDVVSIEGATLRHHPGGWRQWRSDQQEQARDRRRTERTQRAATTSADRAESGRDAQRGRARKRTFREERELAEAEARLEELAARKEALHAELAGADLDHARQQEVATELAQVTEEHDRLEERWLELSMIGEEP